jgi:hypothetical protein
VRANEAAVWHCTVAPPGARHGAGHLSWARHEAAMLAGGLRACGGLPGGVRPASVPRHGASWRECRAENVHRRACAAERKRGVAVVTSRTFDPDGPGVPGRVGCGA